MCVYIKRERQWVKAKVSATWDNPWSSHSLSLAAQAGHVPIILVGMERPLTGCSEKSHISNILLPVLLKCNGMPQTAACRQLVTAGSPAKISLLACAGSMGNPRGSWSPSTSMSRSHVQSPVEMQIHSHPNQSKDTGGVEGTGVTGRLAWQECLQKPF